MFTKYARLEDAEVLDIRSSKERAKTASLDKFSDFHDYRTEDGYLYARIRAISSRVNKNHDGWPSIELAGGQDVFDKHVANRKEASITVEADSDHEFGYSTFLGKPIFVDHHNSDPDRARGVIVDAKLHVEDHKTAAGLDSYYSNAPDNHMPPTWVELLLEVDAKSFPRLAKAIIDGKNDAKAGIDGFSMGCDVEKSVCAICKNAAHSPDEYCDHVRMKGAHFDYVGNDGKKTSKKSYEDCYGIKFFEISAVFDPADETALIRDVVHKEGSVHESDVFPEDDLNKLRGMEDVAGPVGPGVDEFGQPNPSGQIACPECAGAGCQSCGLTGQLQAQAPGSDGYTTPDQLGPGDMNIGPYTDPATQLGINTPRQGSVRTAENPIPQSEMTHAPSEIDTLREETICAVCGSSMDDTTCEICGYVEPPDGFQNPDLQQAKPEEDPGFEQTPAPHPAQIGENTLAEPGLTQGTNPGAIASVKSDMANWETRINPRVAGRINTVEKPITTSQDAQTDEPKEQVVNDETKPVTSSVRTAKEFIEAAGRGKENQMSDNEKVAANPVPAAKPDKRVDVDGTGGVDQASNEQASSADAQVDVEGQGGTGVEGVSADQEGVNVDQGDEHSKNIEGTKTDTWSGEEGQTSPVGGDTFPSDAGQGAGRWSTNIEAAKQGTDPVDPVGKADDRVDLEQEVSVDWGTQPTNWTGTDGNGVTRQQDPVTNDTLEGEDLVDLQPRSSKHIFSAIKLADTEVELGLITAEEKYDRMAELEQKSDEVVEALEAYASQIKTAGLRKHVRSSHTAARVPSFGRSSSASSETSESEVTDESLFL